MERELVLEMTKRQFLDFEERNKARITNERYLIYPKDYAHEESMKYLPAYLAYFL